MFFTSITITISLSEGESFLIKSFFLYFAYQFAHASQFSKNYIKSTEKKPEKMLKNVLMTMLLKSKIFYFTLLINSKK